MLRVTLIAVLILVVVGSSFLSNAGLADLVVSCQPAIDSVSPGAGFIGKDVTIRGSCFGDDITLGSVRVEGVDLAVLK